MGSFGIAAAICCIWIQKLVKEENQIAQPTLYYIIDRKFVY
jgi:hypothetical protein